VYKNLLVYWKLGRLSLNGNLINELVIGMPVAILGFWTAAQRQLICPGRGG
jgi:hypothetical protein